MKIQENLQTGRGIVRRLQLKNCKLPSSAKPQLHLNIIDAFLLFDSCNDVLSTSCSYLMGETVSVCKLVRAKCVCQCNEVAIKLGVIFFLFLSLSPSIPVI